MKRSRNGSTRCGWIVTGLVLLGACSSNVPTGQQLTQVRPLSKAQRGTLQIRLLKGNLPSPDEALKSTQAASDDELISPPGADVASECADFKKSLPVDYMQGMIEVPEDWDNPKTSSTIHVFYYGRPLGVTDSRIPVVFFNGGPGGSSHSSYPVLEGDTVNPRSPKLSFVFIDQRGTGCSDPFPTAIGAENVNRLSHYASRNIVRDAEAIRVKLLGENGKWKVFGQSFGGYIVHRYAEVAPEHVLGFYAHGSSLMDDQVKWTRLRIQSQKRVADTYFQEHPEDEIALRAARKLIPQSRCFTDGEATICGPAVLDGLTIYLGFHDDWDRLHAWIQRLLSHDAKPRLYEDVLIAFLHDIVFGEYDDSGFMANVIGNYEMQPGLADTEKLCKQIYSQLEAAGEKPLEWTINECRLLGGMKTVFDPLIQGMTKFDPLLLEDFEAALKKSPGTLFNLYSGQQDVFVPVETFADETEALAGRIQYTNFPGTGHDGFVTEQRVWDDLAK